MEIRFLFLIRIYTPIQTERKIIMKLNGYKMDCYVKAGKSVYNVLIVDAATGSIPEQYDEVL